MSGWHYRRAASGVTSFTHPDPPPGVSLCSYSRTLDGEHRVRVEANLTTLLHGAEKACYSLAPDELRSAVEAYLETALKVLPHVDVPTSDQWDVHRLDPSQTYRLPDDLPCREVVTAAHQMFRTMANPKQVVSLHNDQTATLRMSKWRSVTVYDKGAEARRKGVRPDALNLLRIEQRIRPRTASGEWKAMRPNLADVDAMLTKSGVESTQLLAQIAQKISATGQLGLVRALMRGGASLNTALRLASVVQLQQEFGAGVFVGLGAAESSASRWRSEVKKYLTASGGEDALLDDLGSLISQMEPMLAREHEVTITKKKKP